MVSTAPTPQQIKEARLNAGLTQAEAAAMVHRHHMGRKRWGEWENGHAPMPAAEWELFTLKTRVKS